MKYYGIDLGNTNTVVSVFENKEPKMISIHSLSYGKDAPYGYPEYLIPTVIARRSANELFFGKYALLQENVPLYQDFKKDIISDNYNKKSPFGNFENAPNLLNCFLDKVISEIQKQELSPFEIAVSHPVDVGRVDGTDYKKILSSIRDKLIKKYNIPVSLRNEPFAASVGYHVYKETRNRLVFVFDFGSSTLNTIILVTGRPNDTIIASQSGWFGGRDIDRYMIKYINKIFFDGKISEDDEDYKLLLNECEKAKIYLTNRHEIDFTFRGKEVNIDKIDFDFKILEPNRIFADIEKILSATLDQARTKRGNENIESVILTGGASLIPSVREQLQAFFNDNNKIIHDQPFTAVASGLSILASGKQTLKELRYDYFIGTYNKEAKKRQLYKIYQKGDIYPSGVIKRIAIRNTYQDIHGEKQDMCKFRFYFYSADSSFSIADEYKKKQLMERYTDITDKHYPIQKHFVFQTQGIEAFEVEYFIDDESWLIMSIFEPNTRKYALTEDEKGQFVLEVKQLKIIELD